MSAEPRKVRAVLSRRRLLVALVVAMLVPAALGAAALTYNPPEPAPTATALRHPSLPQATRQRGVDAARPQRGRDAARPQS